jgi:hypothetical protein
MGFVCIGGPASLAIVACIVEVDRRDDPGLRTKNQEVERQLTDAIQLDPVVGEPERPHGICLSESDGTVKREENS